MWLAVDCGNSRAKWALIKDDGIVNIHSAALGRWDELQRAARQCGGSVGVACWHGGNAPRIANRFCANVRRFILLKAMMAAA